VEYKLKTYDQKQEFLNVASHGLGFIYAVVGTIVLLAYCFNNGDWRAIVGGTVFGISMCLVFFTSALFHGTTREKKKLRFNRKVMDHIAIYYLIAGSYTPFILYVFRDTTSYIILAILWLCTILGTLFKLKFTGRYNLISTAFYLGMGWLGLFLVDNVVMLDSLSVWLILTGGFLYSVGAIVYLIEKIPWNHFIWHLFVMGATLSHYLAVLHNLS